MSGGTKTQTTQPEGRAPGPSYQEPWWKESQVLTVPGEKKWSPTPLDTVLEVAGLSRPAPGGFSPSVT